MTRWLDGTAAPRGGVGYAHDAGPFNMHAELERVWTSARARARAADGCRSQCKKWAPSHTNSYWYVRLLHQLSERRSADCRLRSDGNRRICALRAERSQTPTIKDFALVDGGMLARCE
jgi:hypothetical protein